MLRPSSRLCQVQKANVLALPAMRTATHGHTGLRCRAKAATDKPLSSLTALLTARCHVLVHGLGHYLCCGFFCESQL